MHEYMYMYMYMYCVHAHCFTLDCLVMLFKLAQYCVTPSDEVLLTYTMLVARSTCEAAYPQWSDSIPGVQVC